LGKKGFKGRVNVGKIHQPTGLGINLPLHNKRDAVGVTMQPATFMAQRNVGQ
jgi:hypothetical protein